eukprot:scaffold769_cov72-Phaeocystis_antarctica.AAC.5
MGSADSIDWWLNGKRMALKPLSTRNCMYLPSIRVHALVRARRQPRAHAHAHAHAHTAGVACQAPGRPRMRLRTEPATGSGW